ncbi:hypothetical protein [Parvibium lacunae]|uniref:hypothetical protein n=1 Tax=Parvibium lacunae TaxID=1888893 RepID=UPI001314D95D|nr:hypothetical protein [Parvibium lacunae]
MITEYGSADNAQSYLMQLRTHREWEGNSPAGFVLRCAENYIAGRKISESYSCALQPVTFPATLSLVAMWQGARAIKNIFGYELHSLASLTVEYAGYLGAYHGAINQCTN